MSKARRRARKSRAKPITQSTEPLIRAIIRTNIRNRRVELRISQRELGEMLGVTQQWIGQIESPGGNEIPSIYQLAELADVLKCGYHDLLIEGRFDSGVSPSDDMRKFQHRTR